MMVRPILAATALLLSTTVAEAQDKPPAQKQGAVGTQDEKICEDIVTIGSRLAKKRFCGTRAEWAERKQQDRDALEAAQKSPCVVNGTTCK